MLILIILILAIVSLTALCVYLRRKKDSLPCGELDVAAVVSAIAGVFCLLTCLITIPFVNAVVGAQTTHNKIVMYEEENKVIEGKIDTLVKTYLEYESSTFKELKIDNDADVMVLVSMYPELKADELVKMQIKTYDANNKRIKWLKADLLEVAIYRWWLYFGR